jgi:23S rRNA pseudouridine1911/1915/1917 synthase
MLYTGSVIVEYPVLTMDTLHFDITSDAENERLDRFLTLNMPAYSRMQVQKLIKDGNVQVNEDQSKPSMRLTSGDRLRVELPDDPTTLEIPAKEMPLDIIYEDEHLIAINKPAGVVVHPAFGHWNGTLVNGLLARYPFLRERFTDPERPGIVHRLDKGTSGVMLVALTPEAQAHLASQFKKRSIKKIYWTLVEKRPKTDQGRIDAPVARDTNNRQLMTVTEDGKAALSEYYVLKHFVDHTLVEVHPHTGRTHQIRVHMAFIGCPVVGDKVYGYRQPSIPLGRLFLHARSIGFMHPATEAEMSLEVELPGDLWDILEKLYQQSQ